jgi:hypothetical protein
MHDLDRIQPQISAEDYQYEQFEFEPEGPVFERPFSEAELDELAMELLSVQDEHELDQFLGRFLRRAVKGVGQFLRTPTGQTLKRILRNAVTSAVPGLGVALNMIPAAGIGGPAGAAIKDAVESEGASGSEADVEAAKKLIAVGGSAAQQVAALPANAAPQAAAQAVQSAMQQQGIPSAADGAPAGADTRPTSGEWYRQGRSIVVVGL